MRRTTAALLLALSVQPAWAASEAPHTATPPHSEARTAPARAKPKAEPKRDSAAHPAAHRPAPRHAPPPARAAAHPAVHPAVPAPAPPAAPAAPEAPPPAAAEPAKGSVTGLPLPRFAALKTDEVNLRSGPGLRYPIDWVYKRRDLPVEIEREFEVWRLVSDQDGTKGWVHQATLTGRRTFLVTGAEQTMRDGPSDTAGPVAMLKPGVIGRLRACDATADWCQVQVGDYRGWLKREAFWGASAHEAIQP